MGALPCGSSHLELMEASSPNGRKTTALTQAFIKFRRVGNSTQAGVRQPGKIFPGWQHLPLICKISEILQSSGRDELESRY